MIKLINKIFDNNKNFGVMIDVLLSFCDTYIKGVKLPDPHNKKNGSSIFYINLK